MFKFLKDLFSSAPSSKPHPLDSITESAPPKVEAPAPALEIVAEPAVVIVEQSPTVVAVKKPKAKTSTVKKPAPVKAADKKPRGRKPKAQKKSK